MSAFFIPEDFYTPGQDDTMNTPLDAAAKANLKFAQIAIKGFSQQYRGEWSFTERPMKGDTHNALLLNLGAIEPCAHEMHKVRRNTWMISKTETYWTCECGQEMEIGSFVEKKK